MNEIAYRKPMHVYRSDSCPASMGGCSHEGFVWRFYFPDELQFRTSNNPLKHLAGTISPWVDILAGHLKDDDCALSMTDSTTSEGWTWKTNFKKEMAKLFCMQFVLHADMLFLQRSAVLYTAEHFRENGRHFPFNN